MVREAMWNWNLVACVADLSNHSIAGRSRHRCHELAYQKPEGAPKYHEVMTFACSGDI